ncbi:unnamed protein product [Parajaminaea phylloscopi]
MTTSQPGNMRRSARHLPYLALAAAMLAAFAAVYTHLRIPEALSISQQCRMSRMYPSYVLHRPQSPSGLAKKYSLYMYRENEPNNQPWAEPQLPRRRRPAIFVPGNAGSYGQIRSVASWSHRIYKERGGSDTSASPVWNTDWWTLDFNEDFSAFHAPTLEAQAMFLNEVISYIVAYYQEDGLDSIPILAHSMGGVVARLALSLPNHHESRPIKAIVTLSTPHAVPPAPIEGGLDEIYRRIELHRNSESVEQQALLVSLSGGLLDTQLPSEYSVLSNTSQNSLQGSTSNLPGLWSGADHLAMMWCDQLRRRVSWAIDEEVSRGQREEASARRLRWKRMLGLGGALISPHRSSSDRLSDWLKDAPTVVISSTDNAVNYAAPGDVVRGASNKSAEFQLITDSAVGTDGTVAPGPIPQDRELNVFVCKPSSTAADAGEQICKPMPPWAFDLLPPSSANDQGSWLSFPKAETFYEQPGNSLRFLSLSFEDMQAAGGWTYIQVVRNGGFTGNWRASWTQHETIETTRSMRVSSSGLAPLLGQRDRRDSYITFDLSRGAQSSIRRRFRLPQLGSTLLAYKFTFRSSCQPSEGSPRTSPPAASATFLPMLHVSCPATGDGRWFTSLPFLQTASDEVTLPLQLHCISPFLPVGSPADRGIIVELFDDVEYAASRSCSALQTLEARIDWSKSYGLWLARYRWGILTWTFATFGLLAASCLNRAMSTQTRGDQTLHSETESLAYTTLAGSATSLGQFPDFATILMQRSFTTRGPFVLLFLTLLVLSFVKRFVVIGFGMEERSDAARDLLLGLTGEGGIAFGLLSSDLGLSAFIGTLLLLISWALLTVVTSAAMLLTWATAAIVYRVSSPGIRQWLSFDYATAAAMPIRRSKSTLFIFLASSLLVKTVVPYAFLLATLTLLQLFNVVRAHIDLMTLRSSRLTARDTSAKDRLHQNSFFLFLLLLVLPLKAPTLLVFVRNFLAGYLRAAPPGGSDVGEDHSLWKVLPWLSLVQTLSTGRSLQIRRMVSSKSSLAVVRRLWLGITVVPLSLSLALYALAWGVRYPYGLYDISTLLAAALMLGHYAGRYEESLADRTLLRSSTKRRQAEDAEGSQIHLTTYPSRSPTLPNSEVQSSTVLPYTLPEEFLCNETESSSHRETVEENVEARANVASTGEDTAVTGAVDHSDGSGQILSRHVEGVEEPKCPDLDALLETYLTLVDRYTRLRALCDKSLAQGFFGLSTAQMGSFAGGGWTQGSWSEERRCAFLACEGGQFVMGGTGKRRELGVQIVSEDASRPSVTRWIQEDLEPQAPIAPEDDGELEKRQDPVMAGADGGAESSGLRKRRVGDAPTAKKAGTKGVDAHDDENNKGHDDRGQSPSALQRSTTSGVADNGQEGRAAHEAAKRLPTALERFHSLPPASVRRARDCFQQALQVVITGRERGAGGQSCDELGDAEQTGLNVGDNLGLAGLAVQMRVLEAEIIRVRAQSHGGTDSQ